MKKSIFIVMLVLISATFFSCSKEETVATTYKAFLEISFEGDAIQGTISYKKPDGTKVLKSNSDIVKDGKVIKDSFEVYKGFESTIDIKLSEVYGNLKILWIVKDNKGYEIQKWDKTSYLNNITGIVLNKNYYKTYKEKVE